MSVRLITPVAKLPEIAAAVQQLAQGGSNAIGTFTLTPSATTTTVSNPICSSTSYVFLTPLTPHAANDQALMSIVAGSQQFVVTHANNARNDRTFGYVVLS